MLVAAFKGHGNAPAVVNQLPNEARKLRRFFERWAKRGEVRSCYEATAAGYVLHRDLTAWGHECEVIGHAWKAQHRLHKKYHRISAKKPSRIAVVAVARELGGLFWAVMHDLEHEQTTPVREAA